MEQTRRSMLPLRRIGKQTWNYMLVEPFFWLFYCFFQPIRFKNEFEAKSFWQRIVPMLRLALPIFLLSYPLAFAIQAIFLNSFSFRGPSMQSDVILSFLLTTAWVTVISVGLGTAAGLIGGIAGDISLGIILGTALSISGVAGNSNLEIVVGITVAIAIGSIAGTVKGASFGMWSGALGGIVGGI